VFPLNSKRLKLYELQRLVQALELPTTASSDDLRVMKLRAMDKNPPDTQVVVDVEKERVENLSLQDKDGPFLSFTLPLSSQSPTPQASTHPVERLSSELTEETLVEVKDGHPQEDENKYVQEGTKVEESHGKELSEIEANCVKLQEQLHHSTEEISLLEQCLREKEQELYAKEQDLNVLEDTLAKERALTETLIGKVEILQQQQQLAAEETERLTRKLEMKKSRIKELWKTS